MIPNSQEKILFYPAVLLLFHWLWVNEDAVVCCCRTTPHTHLWPRSRTMSPLASDSNPQKQMRVELNSMQDGEVATFGQNFGTNIHQCCFGFFKVCHKVSITCQPEWFSVLEVTSDRVHDTTCSNVCSFVLYGVSVSGISKFFHKCGLHSTLRPTTHSKVVKRLDICVFKYLLHPTALLLCQVK